MCSEGCWKMPECFLQQPGLLHVVLLTPFYISQQARNIYQLLYGQINTFRQVCCGDEEEEEESGHVQDAGGQHQLQEVESTDLLISLILTKDTRADQVLGRTTTNVDESLITNSMIHYLLTSQILPPNDLENFTQSRHNFLLQFN